MSRNPYDHPAFRRYAKHFFDEVAPKISSSAFTITVAPPRGKEDVHIATELGYSILLDKPLIVFVPAGQREHVAQKLLRIADHVIEGEMETPEGREAMQHRLMAVLRQ